MDITLYFFQLRERIRDYFVSTEHVQTSNTGLVALVATCMIFVSFISNKPDSLAPLLQANIQNASTYSTPHKKTTLQPQTIVLNGIEYYLIPKQ